MDTVAERYAESLFALACEEDAISSYLDDMKLVDEVLESDPKIVQFFSHVLISDEDKCKLLDDSFSSSINKYVLNFLKLLVKKRRIRYIRDIVKSFIGLCNKKLGIEEGLVYTPYALSDEQLKDVEKAMSEKENKTIVLRQIIDESLIGGIKVQINTRVYDDSIKNKVEKLRSKLLESR
ncbi:MULTISPECIES: F0F1 ATP synthase subunit delta [Kandleria]|jgi:F-type H+-transporting ATPase subunit delta|uniref:F0F1 ATP synthase subunit delta n=1 Tax=Kandleria TaxID=1279388 RepID=UPI000E7F972D|nr:F0F1 ATP synthase subunit delta [Kandleria sp.]HAD23474.1 F0F1 ATP synthase subunit delta [Kandleria vitulina]MBP3275691.1 F0F1 ATP synthase subunit delta [Kandleria sp.]HAH74589.1 F0F1 ATP synthase subunit delta [Kandleria vitulina]HBG67940.1 F0F1 ATP synthase subunit delta [Kandleria vitulina]HCY52704.1 F0F1 ATP synthase subunit delta [Kandleria vitulina]